MSEEQMPRSANNTARKPTSRTWVAPAIEDLPALTQLTLQTGIPDTTPEGGGMTI